MKNRIVTLTLALSLVPALAQAHPGHGTGASFLAGAVHPLVGVDHLMALLAAGLLAWRMGGVARTGIVLAFPALLALGALAGLAGFEFALTETMILLSIAVLGLLALRPPRRLPAMVIGTTALFALFHGHAHGLEAASGTAASGFVIGLALASALVIVATMLVAQAVRTRAAVGARR